MILCHSALRALTFMLSLTHSFTTTVPCALLSDANTRSAPAIMATSSANTAPITQPPYGSC